MSSIHPVTRSRHTGLRWKRFSDYHFAATTAVAPLAAAEITQAALALPLAFIQRDEGWSMAAVLSLLPSQNLYIDDRGAWIAEYVPAVFRAHPFRTGWAETGEPTLCVDEGSRLVTEGPEGEAFFDAGGNLGESLQRVWGFLRETAQSELVLIQACGILFKAGVVEPWPITVQGVQGPQEVVGLYRINEVGLNGLDVETFGQLRRAGVVGLAYAQLLSMGNLAKLGHLAQARAQAEAAERARAEVKPLIMLPEDNTIDWDWSKIGR